MVKVLRLLVFLSVSMLLACSGPRDGEGGEKRMVGTKVEKIAHISSLGYSGNLDHAKEVAEYLEDDEPEVVGQACFYLGYLEAREYIPRLAQLLEHEDATLVNMAASGLGLMVDGRDDDLLKALYRLLDSSNLSVRMSAIEAIGKIQAEESAATLISRFYREEPAAKLQIIQALGLIRSQKALPLLEGYLKEVKAMDHSVPNKGGVRGSVPHPSAMQAVLEEAISSIRAS
jgi:HEAT repeat protein